MKNNLQTFRSNGWTVEKIFSQDQLFEFQNTLLDLICMQLIKLGIKPSKILDNDIIKLNKKNSAALTECLNMSRNTKAGHSLSSTDKLVNLASTLLDSSLNLKKRVLISGPSIFVNIPNDNKRKYTWHSEQNWYPKRRSFLNIWCPLSSDRIKKNSMAIMNKSHKENWFYFSEYVGYEKNDSKDMNVQYEIPPSLLKDYKIVVPNVKIGEGLFFNGKIVHRSIDNRSKKPLITMVFRVFNYSDDLTLSSNWAEIPYNRKSLGAPNLNVKKTK